MFFSVAGCGIVNKEDKGEKYEYDIVKVFENEGFTDIIAGKNVPVELLYGEGGEGGTKNVLLE